MTAARTAAVGAADSGIDLGAGVLGVTVDAVVGGEAVALGGQ